MGKVNDYIKKLLNFVKGDEENTKYEKPWHKYYEGQPIHINYYNGSIYDKLYETACEYSNLTAYEYFGVEATFPEFIRKIDKIANALTQFKIVENECVTVCLPNTPESFALIYAINKIGAIANVVHPLSAKSEIERALKEGNSSIIFYSDVSSKNVNEIKVKNKILVPTSYSFPKTLKFLYGLKNKESLKVVNGAMSFEQFMQYTLEEDIYVKRFGKDPAAIIYSGGTTGKPKGIIISNQNFNAMAQQTPILCQEIKPGRSILSCLPIFHVFGLAVCCHTALVSGLKCIIVPRINTKKLNKELKKYSPNIMPAVPSMLRVCLKDKDPGYNAFKDIKIFVVGGDYLPPDLKRDFEKFARDHGSNGVIKVGYGLSESTGFCASTAPVPEDEVLPGTLGVPNPDMDVRVFEPNTDIEKALGDIGEICVNGPTVMMGYINEDEETKKTLVIHNDGKIWLHTGDLGYVDESGRIFFSSRLKRMIISNGYNIYPIELENIISKHKAVASVTVVGIPHKTKGQTPKAVIVLKDGFENNLDLRADIRQYCKDNMALYAVPTEFEYRDSMPITAIGKVSYRDLEKKSDKKED
ncbi:MAG: acyl--CoA ligase [Bacilli bacterium]|nr:acyl--CoA ligase [Bacilli bacterium]